MQIKSLLGFKAVLLLGLLASASADAALRYEWRDRFSQAEKRKLTSWVNETVAALEEVVGPYPFDVRIIFHRYSRASEPVPWANTERTRIQGVHFHVDPRFDLQDFRKDWTAPHELSHLIIPYLGSRNSWFAEGFASYMQYKVMEQMGVLDHDQMEKRYMRNFRRAESGYRYSDRPFAQAASRLRSEGRYSVMYWGGGVYFKQVEEILKQEKDTNLTEVLSNYLLCCRHRRGGLQTLIRDLDRISNTRAFADTLSKFNTENGFPDFR